MFLNRFQIVPLYYDKAEKAYYDLKDKELIVKNNH
jgi:hypothetical protein